MSVDGGSAEERCESETIGELHLDSNGIKFLMFMRVCFVCDVDDQTC